MKKSMKRKVAIRAAKIGANMAFPGFGGLLVTAFVTALGTNAANAAWSALTGSAAAGKAAGATKAAVVTGSTMATVIFEIVSPV